MEEQLIVDFFTEEKKHWWHIAKRNLIKQFIVSADLKILVAGVGGGMICEELKKAGHDVIGIDISTAACEYVNKKTGIPVISGDLEKPLIFNSGSFDLIIIADVLEHIENEKQLLAEAFRCLKPKGRMIVTVPAYPHLWSPWDTRLNHKRRYSPGSLKKEITGAGFSVKKMSYFHMLLYPFAYVYRIILPSVMGKYPERSDFSVIPNRFVSWFFACYYVLERRLLNFSDLPFGLSIFAIGVKCG